MIIGLILAAIADFFLFAFGLLLSFVISPPLRRYMRIATGILAIPLIPVAYFIEFPDALVPLAWHEPRNLAELQKDFQPKRADLETLLRMSDEDKEFTFIAPGFVNRSVGGSERSTQYAKIDPQIGLSEPRWDAYRAIFAREGIKNGIDHSIAGDVSIEIDTVGLFKRGHVVGYKHCAQNPCDHNPVAGSMSSFQRLDGGWYAFEQ